MEPLDQLASGIELAPDGVWYARTAAAVSYPDEGNAACAQIEDTSFWFKHRNRCITALVRAHPPNGPIFDIGGGNGYVARGLSDAGFQVVLIEPGRAGARTALDRGLDNVVCASLEQALFRAGALTSVGLFDVIEHIEDDVGFLNVLHELMAANGKIYLTVPAYSFLWSREDIDAGHYRRYTLASISDALGQANFDIDYATYIFWLLPVPIFFLRSLPARIVPASQPRPIEAAQVIQEHTDSSLSSRLVTQLLAAEPRAVASGRRIPCGGSCLVAATRRD